MIDSLDPLESLALELQENLFHWQILAFPDIVNKFFLTVKTLAAFLSTMVMPEALSSNPLPTKNQLEISLKFRLTSRKFDLICFLQSDD